MTDTAFAPVVEARLTWQGATPFAPAFGDTYFARDRGVEESGAVFIEGNRLDQRFSLLRPGQVFTIGEVGFGTGLNMLLAAARFVRRAPDGARLQLASVERFPLTRADLRRALDNHPVCPDLARALLAGYPPPAPGFHRLRLAPGIDLTLMLADAGQAWGLFSGAVDAWFLDGFAPARNPQAWTRPLYLDMASASRPGATVATFTAAGHVRRGLTEAGFVMDRRPGFGGKRERLVGRFGKQDWQPAHFKTGLAIVAGAGLAGATTARALAERGWKVAVHDPAGIAGQASGNPAGVVHATPGPHPSPRNRLHQAGLLHARRWLEHHRFPGGPEQGRLNGVIQHLVDQRIRRKVQGAMASGTWPEDMLAAVGPDRVCLPTGGYIRPADWCRQLLDHPAISLSRHPLTGVHPGRPPRAAFDGLTEAEADRIILCTAGATRHFPGMEWLPVRLIRGQVTLCRPGRQSRQWEQARCHHGYLTPTVDGLHSVGATFDRQNLGLEARDEDDRTNLRLLESHLPGAWRQLGGRHIRVAGRRVGLRCHSPDHLPLAGTAPGGPDQPDTLMPGIYLNIAHGSRGITSTPICADLIADQASGLAAPVDRQVMQALEPRRFVLRKRHRNGNHTTRVTDPDKG